MSLPPEIIGVIRQLKEQGMDIDESNPQEAMRILMQLMGGRPQRNIEMLPAEECPPGSDSPIPDAPARDTKHFTLHTELYEPFPDHLEMVQLGMGCFWCSENLFVDGVKGVYSTQVGYAGGVTNNPSYKQVCTGRTNHNEVVRVVYDPKQVKGILHEGLDEILRIFWETHDPTTPMQQGNDQGTQYRSGIYYYTEEQRVKAERSRDAYAQALKEAGHTREISTEILPAPHFYMAEDYHQQYDAKPGSNEYCGLAPLGVSLPKL